MTRYEKYQRMTIDEAAELISGIDKDGCTIKTDFFCNKKYCEKSVLSVGDTAYYIFNYIPSGRLDINKCQITNFKRIPGGIKIEVDDAIEFDEQDLGKYLFCGEKAEIEALEAILKLQAQKTQSPILKGKKDENKEENT